jgi:outer membrane protein assembly factor BamB
VNPETGAIEWQTALGPDANLGTSEAATPMLSGGGKAVQVGDDGLVRRFDIASGALDYAEPFVEGLIGDGETPSGCPNIIAEAHMPSTISAHSGLIYAAQHNGCRADLGEVGNLAGEDEGGLYAQMTTATGALSAIDPATGLVRAEHFFDYPLQSGLLSTAGGLVFAATADGSLHALDDETLNPLWSLHVSSFMATPPVTYAVGDTQYVAMIVGGGPLYGDLPMRSRSMTGVRHVSVLAVFGVAP